MSTLLSFDSLLSCNPKNINVTLKNHQLAMLKRCNDIENIENNIFGIMSDKPGTGKTYVILSLIYESLSSNKTNIIVVPQNIYTQWIISIENFSSELSYKKFIDYENIMTLYTNPTILNESNIILTTSSYYHIIATTIESLDIKISRIFFDEIDSISNIICTKINSDFIWFVSASFNLNSLGYYQNKINTISNNIDDITCKCDNEFIDSNIFLEDSIKTYYLCKNIYIDNILDGIVSNKEIKGLNAMDYTLYNKEFQNARAKDETEIIELILKNRKSIIEFDKFKMNDATEKIIFYTDFKNNKELYENNFKNILNSISIINTFKTNILDFLLKFNDYTDFYLIIDIDDKNGEKIIKETYKEELKTLRNIFDDIIGILYDMNDIENIYNSFICEKYKRASVNNINIKIKTFSIMLTSIYDIMTRLKDKNNLAIYVNNIFNNFYEIFLKTKDYINELINSISNFENSIISENQLDIYEKILEVSKNKITENELKINLVYQRLQENNCCPVCYQLFENMNNKKIYITSSCCNNKVCEDCINEWYNLNKSSCIFCNTCDILKDSLVFYDNKNNLDICNDTCENINIEINENINIDTNENIKYEEKNLNKNIFLKNFIEELKTDNKKVIIFSDYSSVFEYIENICKENEINYIDLDKGNIKDINISVHEYKYGNAQILLSNSILFGCGMNFENSTHIIFVHKMDQEMENQVIGRAQRMGRKGILNIIYLHYENESIYSVKNTAKDFTFLEELNKNNELEEFYHEKQYYNLIENIQNMDFTNEITEIPTTYDEVIDVNLDSLIESLF
jgi:hypothetical protein